MIAKPERWFVLALLALACVFRGVLWMPPPTASRKKWRSSLSGSPPQPQIVTGSAKDSHTSWPCACSMYPN